MSSFGDADAEPLLQKPEALQGQNLSSPFSEGTSRFEARAQKRGNTLVMELRIKKRKKG